MKDKILLAILVFSLSFLPAARLLAYEAQTVNNGGTIVGVVKFKGTAPKPKQLQVTKDQKVCGKTPKFDQSLMVAQGDVDDSVVFISDIQKGKKMETGHITLDQRGCEYHPHVLAFPAGATLDILNPDGILHNIHSYSKINSPFNLAQPGFKKTISVKIDKPETIRIQCDVHDWMHGWLFAADNPYYSVTDKNGNFRITEVPPGTYTLKVWQETLGTLSQKVTVKPNEETKVTFELAKK
jgi:plastocyanin